MKNLLHIIILLVYSSFSYAQLGPKDDIRDLDLGCNSNNYTVLETLLSGSPTDSSVPVSNCSPGDIVTAYVWVKYNSNANSSVHAFTIFADLLLNHQDNTSTTIFYQKCVGDLNSSQNVINEIQVDTINWTCGDEIIFMGSTLAWVTGGGVDCNNVQLSDYNKAQCDNVGDVLVDAPLIANYISESNCNSNLTLDFTSTTTGGKVKTSIDVLIPNPYMYTWDWGDGSPIIQTPFLPADTTFQHTFPNPGNYSVLLTVEDGDGNIDSISKTITVYNALSIQETHQNNTCGSSNDGAIDISVLGGLAPYVYDWDNDGFDDSQDLINITSGSYTVIVKDANDCTIQLTIEIIDGDNIPPVLSAPNDISIEGCSVSDLLNYSESLITISEQDLIDQGGSVMDDSNINITYIDSQSGSCPTIVTRVFTSTDECLNSSMDTQIITIQDTASPTFIEALPTDITISCDNIPVAEILTSTDICDSNVTDIYNEVISDQDNICDNTYTITRTWTAIDCSGNSTTHVQVITVEDNEAPTFDPASLPADVTVNCQDAIPALNTITLVAQDNCASVADITIVANEVITNQDNACDSNYTLTRTWTATDCNNNSFDYVQVITVEDNEAPTFDPASLPADVTVNCQDAIPALNTITLIAQDNCASVADITIVANEVITNQDNACDSNYTLTRTWTATDCNNNSFDYVQVITVEDNEAPTFDPASLPADVTVNCQDAIPALNTITLVAQDNCASVADITIVANEVITNQDNACDSNYTLTRTWTATDCNNNSFDYVQVITVEDNEAPTFDPASLPADVTVNCQDAIPALNTITLVAQDNCASVADITIIANEVITNQDNACDSNYTLTRTWTATDCNNNSFDYVQVITVEDNEAPTFDPASLPADVTVNCQDAIPALNTITLVAQDNCASVADITIVANEVITNQDNACDSNYTLTRTWTATDCNNNSFDYVQVITVEDNEAPTFDPASLPADVTVNCQDAIPALNTITLVAQDNCASVADITIIANEVITNQDNACDSNYTLTRTWTATDCNNNSFDYVQVITVEDNEAPTFDPASLPADVTVNCQDAIPALNTITLVAQDNCASVADITIVANEVITNQDNACDSNYTLTRTWTATDCNNNSFDYVQVITVEDNEAPTFDPASLPADVTVNCQDAIPALNTITLVAQDNCASVADITIVANEVITGQDDGCDSNYTLTRTWTATDCNNNSFDYVQVITVEDNEAPTFDPASLPADVTVNCQDAIPALNTITLVAQDNCASVADITIVANEVITNQDNACDSNYTLTRTWTATDCNNNSFDYVQVITVEDNEAPTFDPASLPADVTVNCQDAIPALNTITLVAQDNCASVADITIVANEVITNQDNACDSNYTLTRTWTATDCNNNSFDYVQVITVEDNEAPTFDPASLPADVTVNCQDAIPALNTITLVAQDNCASVAEITIVANEVITGQNDGCANTYQIERTWTASDCNGNSFDHVQIITVVDIEAPDFVEALPVDATVECDNIPVAITLTAIDNCDTNINVTFGENIVTDPNGCVTNYTINRTWTVTDCAGNTTSHAQVITVEDSSDPILSGSLPADETVNCDNIPIAAILTVSDNCGNSIPINYSEAITNQDNTCDRNYTITRTWTVTDCAGNSTTHIQVITVEDNEAPTFDPASLPADVTVNCQDAVPALNTITLVAQDNCASVADITIVANEVITNQDNACDSNYTLTRTWTATDCNNNSFDYVQVITVEDNEAPTFDPASLPVDVTVNCQDAIPALNTITLVAQDNCASVADITIVANEVITNQDNACDSNYTLTRTWTATDCNNNSFDYVQVITVEDNEAPTFDPASLPADVTVNCQDAIPALNTITLVAQDNCASVADITIVANEVITNQDNACDSNYTLTRTWTATDCNNNSFDYVQVITVEDNEAPTFDPASLPADVTVNCQDAIPALNTITLVAQDNCASVAEITIVANEVITGQNDGCANTYQIERTWTASDCNGNSFDHVQIITVVDIEAPIFVGTIPQDITMSCEDSITPLNDVILTAQDNCSLVADLTIVPTEVITGQNDDCPNTYTITRTWELSDCAGNITSHTQEISIEDNTAPIITTAIDAVVSITCVDLPVVPEIEATDNCDIDTDIIITHTETINTIDDDNYDIIWTWIATDVCGNSSSIQQIIHVVIPVLDTNDAALCITHDILDLYTLISTNYSGLGYFEITSGNYTLTDEFFDPTVAPIGDYVITFYSDDDCELTGEININVNDDCIDCLEDLYISKVVTPNDDGFNDYFKVEGINCGIPAVKIFNRWGTLVFEDPYYQASKDGGWNGQSQGGITISSNNGLSTGTYYYIIELPHTDIKPISGHVYLGTK